MTALAEAECALPIARRNCFVVAGIYMTRLSARAWLEIAPAFRRFGSRRSARRAGSNFRRVSVNFLRRRSSPTLLTQLNSIRNPYVETTFEVLRLFVLLRAGCD